MPHRSRRGFTIVEILVVLGIIVLLVGLVAVGLQTAGRSARKAKELNTGRQVGLAWSQYSATYEEKLIPGWLEPEVQQAWKVKYKNSGGDALAPEFCRTYAWRLMPFLSFDFETLYGYLEIDGADFDTSPALVADSPAFGINAYYDV
ncbi:MAG: type II secretion system protein, partial [Phycisphaerales bacterium]